MSIPLEKQSISHASARLNASPLNNQSYCRKPSFIIAGLTASVLFISGCQTISPVNKSGQNGQLITPEVLPKFNIRGKIGIATLQTAHSTAQSGSAFYVWAQDNDRFAIEITGPLGIGRTAIEYNGTQATLVSERTGKISAENPEALLYKATGWSAPISQLPYWISGHPAPSDNTVTKDTMGRLNTATNTDWLATFSYSEQNRLPNKIKAQREDGHKVIMTITHMPPN